jgi:hypothetical protein
MQQIAASRFNAYQKGKKNRKPCKHLTIDLAKLPCKTLALTAFTGGLYGNLY